MLKYKSQSLVYIVGHRGMVRRNGGLSACQKLHQGQAKSFTRRGIDIEIAGTNESLVVLILQKTMQNQNTALKRGQGRQQRHQRYAIKLEVVVSHFDDQGGLVGVFERPAERSNQIDPVLAAVGRIENGGVDDSSDLNVLRYFRDNLSLR